MTDPIVNTHPRGSGRKDADELREELERYEISVQHKLHNLEAQVAALTLEGERLRLIIKSQAGRLADAVSGITKLHAENVALAKRVQALDAAASWQPILAGENIMILREAIRSLDCGAHYCRYCHAGTDNQWKHTEHCPYQRSLQLSEQARKIVDQLQALQPAPPAADRRPTEEK